MLYPTQLAHRKCRGGAGRIAALALLTASALTPALAQTPAAAPTSGISNEFVRVVINPGPKEAGRFSIRTTGGDPSRPASSNKHLIFGGNAPWTSYTTVLIDGEKYVFGGPTDRRAGKSAKVGTLVGEPKVGTDSVAVTCRTGDVEVVQELSFMRGPSTRMYDTVLINYHLTNKGSAPREVGLRLLLDTMLGANDAAPVRAGDQAITTASALSDKAVPDYWQAFDSVSNPTVISQGSLRGNGLTPPQKILFADWGTLADEVWEPQIAPGQGFVRKGEEEPDTATALLWSPATLEPGATRTISTAYGIGGVSLNPGQLALGLTAPSESTFLHERTLPLTIAGYLENTGGFDARDVSLTLTLPAGLELISGNPKLTYPHLAKGETVQASWTVRPNGKVGGKLPLGLAVTSANIEANRLTRDIQVDVPASRLRTLTEPVKVPLETNNLPTVVLVPITLTPATNFSGARVVLSYNPEVIKPFDISRGRAFVDNNVLLPGWEFDTSQEGRVVITATRGDTPPLTQAEVNLAVIKFRTVNPGTSALKFTQTVIFTGKGEMAAVESGEATVQVIGQ